MLSLSCLRPHVLEQSNPWLQVLTEDCVVTRQPLGSLATCQCRFAGRHGASLLQRRVGRALQSSTENGMGGGRGGFLRSNTQPQGPSFQMSRESLKRHRLSRNPLGSHAHEFIDSHRACTSRIPLQDLTSPYQSHRTIRCGNLQAGPCTV